MEIPDLAEYTYDLLRQVPPGRVTTYGALAEALGAREAARLVGELMAKNPYAPEVPCHRVVHSDGRLGKFSAPGGSGRKAELLVSEGVEVRDGKVVDFEARLFTDFRTERPLAALREYQLSLIPKLKFTDEREPYASLLAVDVAYTPFGAFAAGALHGLREGAPGPTVAIHVAPRFPYIPTFLGFREIPAIRAVLDLLPARPDVLLLDGNGTLHPMGIGLASQAGVELDIPTVGVAKSLLCGEPVELPTEVGGSSEVLVDGSVRGYALRVSPSPRGIVYVSPGHLVSPRKALELVKGLVEGGRVAPLYRAHTAAREAAMSFHSGD
ncbi:MAG: endonuclease V [Thermoplasmata archaeon]